MERFFHSVYRFDYRDSAILPRRFTARQLTALEALSPSYEHLGRCTAGISLKMRVSSPEIAFSYQNDVLYTRTGGFDIWENGVLVDSQVLPETFSSGRFTYRKKSSGETFLEIFLPSNSECALSEFDFGDAVPVEEPEKPFLLFLGDSITQAAYTTHHSLAFAPTVARMMNARYLNRGIGSLYYDVSELDENDGLSPDIVLVMLGANDLVRRENHQVVYADGKAQYYTTAEIPLLIGKAEAYLKKAKEIYPSANIFVSTLTAATAERPEGETLLREDYNEALRSLISRLGLSLIEGASLTPVIPEARAADGIHFSDLGGITAAQSLFRIFQRA